MPTLFRGPKRFPNQAPPGPQCSAPPGIMGTEVKTLALLATLT